MHHCHRSSVRSGDHIDHLIGAGQRLFEDYHREGRSSGRYIARADPYGIGRNHTGARISFRRAEGNAGAQLSAVVKQCGTFFGEPSRRGTGRKDAGKYLFESPVETALNLIQRGKLLYHIRAVTQSIYREHTRCITYSQHLFRCQERVHKTCKGIDGGDTADVLLLIEYSLIQVRNAPAERDVEVKQGGELRSGLGGVGIAPGPEGDKQLSVLVEGKIAVHHGAYAYRCKSLYFNSIALEDIFPQAPVALSQARFDVLFGIGPQSVLELVLPLISPQRDGIAFPVDEHCLDAGRAELDTERSEA